MNKFSSFSAFILSATVFFVAGFWFLALPQLETLGNLHAEQQALQQDPIITAQSIREKQDANNVLQTKAQAQLLLPAQDDQYDLSVQVEGLADQLQLPLTSLTINSADTKGALPPTTGGAKQISPITAQKLTVSVGVTGEYARVQQFVTSLPTINRYLQIDQVIITSAAETTSASNQVTAQIVAFAYYIPTPK